MARHGKELFAKACENRSLNPRDGKTEQCGDQGNQQSCAREQDDDHEVILSSLLRRRDRCRGRPIEDIRCFRHPGSDLKSPAQVENELMPPEIAPARRSSQADKRFSLMAVNRSATPWRSIPSALNRSLRIQKRDDPQRDDPKALSARRYEVGFRVPRSWACSSASNWTIASTNPSKSS